ncbi:MAG: response regulator [Candidatus Omnitrophica bacterium]|nr:response regulator [Candidatus Omnitrophota bacterium]
MSEKIGISEEEFERKLAEVRKRNITPLGGELAYLITNDSDYTGKVKKQLFKKVGIQVKLKKNVSKLMKTLNREIGVLDGREAFNLVNLVNPDLIILDLMLPVLHGYEVLRRIKKNMRMSHILLVILSAKTLKMNIDKGMRLDADDYAIKLFSVAELVIKVKDSLKNKMNVHKEFTCL